MKLENKKVLVVGASSDMARPLNEQLCNSGAILGLHYNKNKAALAKYTENKKLKKIQKEFDSSQSCYKLIDDFVSWAGGLDCLVQLSGNIKRPVHWQDLKQQDWDYDLSTNLTTAFFLAQRAVRYMKDRGGRIILTSTASAAHGGGSLSLAYGAAKAGVECVVKRLARDCGKYNILVNAVAPGFILTKFHTQKMNKSEEQLKERIALIPWKRAGRPEEVSRAIMFLLCESSYITGQTIAVSGGDWL